MFFFKVSKMPWGWRVSGQRLRIITLIQLMSCSFVLPSVSLQNNLWKNKSCEQDTSSPHVCPSLLSSVSLHSITPSFSKSIHQQKWCAVITVRPSVCLSTCKTPPGSYLSACVSAYLYCMYWRVCLMLLTSASRSSAINLCDVVSLCWGVHICLGSCMRFSKKAILVFLCLIRRTAAVLFS